MDHGLAPGSLPDRDAGEDASYFDIGEGEQDVAQPDVDEPDTEDPDVGEPDVGDPGLGDPDVGDPDVGEPDVGEPVDCDEPAVFCDHDGAEIPVVMSEFGGVLFSNITDADSAFDDDPETSTSVNGFIGIPFWVALGKEWPCPMRIQHIVLEGPEGGSFLSSPDGPEAGEIEVRALPANGDNAITLMSVDISDESPSEPIHIDLRDDDLAGPFIGHRLHFDTDGPFQTTLQITGMRFYGECMGPESVFEWETGDWQCTDAVCDEVENDGTLTRDVTCWRDGELPASHGLCPLPAPADEDGECTFECPFELSFIGYRPFTYANDSGWLHEGNLTRRAGPLPSSTSFGNDPESNDGRPCSIETTQDLTYFVGISCTADGDYCAFRCL